MLESVESPSEPSSLTSFLDGGGELGALLRAHDFSATPLGPPASWPRSLKTAVRIMLTSRQPFWLGWGPELTYLYNDPYRSIIGGKHPNALGRPFREVWHEIWDVVGPMAERVMQRDEGTYVEAQLLIMQRHGYQEETYYTFSYSPIPGDEGGTAGLICANTDDTQRVIGARQMRTLRELSAQGANARTRREACASSVEALGSNPQDLPFVLIYLTDATVEAPVLAASTPGMSALEPLTAWPWRRALETQTPELVDLNGHQGPLPRGAWQRAPASAVVLPLSSAGSAGRAGVLVAGLNPYRRFDDAYRGFLDLVAHQVAGNLANAEAYEHERQRADALLALDRAKTEFFSNVSHEFRTPLTLMLGPLEDTLTQSDALSDVDRARLELAHKNSLRLQKLVNTLLEFSRIEAGRTEARYEATDLAAFTAELASVFRSAVERAGLALTVDCPPLAAPVRVDREMWENIVFNLLSNALKFTFEGEIRVSVRAADAGVLFSVSDTGTGIPAADLPHVFERFHRVQGARGRSIEGSGIGLALVRELVKLHGGKVSVESTLDRGSTFEVWLPLGDPRRTPAPNRTTRSPDTTALRRNAYMQEALDWLPAAATADQPVGPAADEAPRGTSSPAARVLLCEDNADMRGYLARLLSETYAVETVSDGRAGLAAARRQAPDLIVTDVMMPGLDGFGLLRELRADPGLARIPVIMLSARAGESSRIEGIRLGADDYLVKPFSARELLARIETRLEVSRLERDLENRRGDLALLVNQLRESDRRKDEFLATLAHELRNPLAPLQNALHGLRLVGDGEAQNSRVREIMERQVGHLVRLVDDLLEISRISRGTFELRRERVEVATIVRNAIETSEPLVRAAGQELAVTLPKQPLFLDGDPTRLTQILANLLNNAAKYTDSGGHIALSVSESGGEVVLSVRDDGMGIEPEALSRIFEMFSRGDGAKRSQGGLGIGLTLARRLAEMHGGNIDAASAGPGRGAEFTVRLPLAAADLAPAPEQRNEPALGARKRVLVVDDNIDAAEALGLLLEVLGAEVKVAHDGPTALEHYAAYDPDLVFLDIGMPDMDGHEVARRIRADYAARRTTLVALTGWGQAEDRRRAREAGFDDHLVKPAGTDALKAVLAAVPGRRGVQRDT